MKCLLLLQRTLGPNLVLPVFVVLGHDPLAWKRQRLTGGTTLRQTTHHTKTDAEVTERGDVAATAGGTTAHTVVVTRAPTQATRGTRRWTSGIDRCLVGELLVVISGIPILAPFPNLPVLIKNPQRVRCVLTYRRCLVAVAIGLLAIQFTAKPKGSRRARSARIFPFRLGGQSIALATIFRR